MWVNTGPTPMVGKHIFLGPIHRKFLRKILKPTEKV
jgi:hypothetical protein